MSRETDILKHAAKVFQRLGVSRTTLEDIAKEVGVKRESLYYYFKSRDEIVVKLLLPQAQALNRGFEEILNSGQSPKAKLRSAIRHHLASFNPKAFLEMTVALREHHLLNDTDIEKAAELQQLWRANGRLWTALIQQGQEEGAFNPELDPKIVAFGLLGMCNWLARWFDPRKGTMSLDEIIGVFSTIALTGVAARGSRATTKHSNRTNFETRVPKTHSLRSIREITTSVLAEVWDELAALDTILGPSSIPREMMLRALLLSALHSIRQDRQLMEQLEYNNLFRWFVGLHGDTAAWDPTVFAQNRERLLTQDVARRFLSNTMQRAIAAGIVPSELFTVDEVLVRAWAQSPKTRRGGQARLKTRMGELPA
jgi:AcrR family transcriptional regulator